MFCDYWSVNGSQGSQSYGRRHGAMLSIQTFHWKPPEACYWYGTSPSVDGRTCGCCIDAPYFKPNNWSHGPSCTYQWFLIRFPFRRVSSCCLFCYSFCTNLLFLFWNGPRSDDGPGCIALHCPFAAAALIEMAVRVIDRLGTEFAAWSEFCFMMGLVGQPFFLLTSLLWLYQALFSLLVWL